MRKKYSKRCAKKQISVRTRKKKQVQQHTHLSSPLALSASMHNPPKVALLFLTRVDHEQPKLWHTFLQGHHRQFSVYCHPANPAHIAHNSFLRRTPHSSAQEGILPSYKCIPKPNNRWAHLTLAYYQLLHHAFHDTENNNQRFMFVSETCVPCVPANTAYQQLTQDLDVTYMDAPQPNDNADRYDQTVTYPRTFAFPEHMRQYKMKSAQCSSLLQKSGIERKHFVKHSGWFSPNRRDAQRLLRHKDAFEALNMISAGDEHILSILHRPSYKTTSTIRNHRITYVEWDDVKMKQCKAMLEKEDDAFWTDYDRHPQKYAQYMQRRKVLKEANMHPIQHTRHVPNRVLVQCKQANSLFLRKVRQSCNTHNVHKLLLAVDKPS